MFALDSRFRGNDGAVVVGGGATDNNRAAVVGTVATVGDGVGNGAIATVTVTNPDDETIATSATAHKSSFPRTRESRIKNSAQPTEFNAVGVGNGVVGNGVAVTAVTVVSGGGVTLNERAVNAAGVYN